METPRHAAIPSTREALHHFARLARLIGPYWSGFTKSVILGTVIGVTAMIGPYTSKVLIDQAYPARDMSLMHLIVMITAILSVSRVVFGALQGYFTQVINAELTTATDLMFFNHLQHMPAGFFDSHQVGEILSRMSDSRGGLATVTGAFQIVLSNVAYLLIAPAFLLLLNWKLTLLSVVVFPLTAATATLASRITRRYYKQAAEAGASLGAYQMETLTHIRMFKAMAFEPTVYRRVHVETHARLNLSMKASRLQTLVGAGNGLIGAAGSTFFMWYAWTLIMSDQLTFGGFIAFSAYLAFLTGPAARLAGLFASLQQASVTLGRMFEYLDMVPEQDPSLAYAPHGPITTRIKGSIRFENVTCSYGVRPPVLHDVSLAFPAGTVTAVVGISGAGKSSLLRTIPRLVEMTSGRITIDGTPLTHFTLPDLRRQIAVVWQEFGLVQGTIRDNLTLQSEVTRSALDEVIDVCGLDSLIRSVPRGLDAHVGEFGSTLSGGQRQRIAIARALLRDTPILLLDEATASIDVRGEEELLRKLFSRKRDRTIVLVTHRIPTTAMADQICLIADGRVAGSGTPAELRESNLMYRGLLGLPVLGRPGDPEIAPVGAI